MDEGRSGSRRSLTGVWEGIYSYPVDGLPTVPFTATLLDAGSMLSGVVHEVCTLPGSAGETLFFSLNGSRRGSAVDFIKTYEGANPNYQHPIVYAGTLNEDATEIEGHWTIPGAWSGRFLMTRSGDQPQAAAESAGAASRLETVDLPPGR